MRKMRIKARTVKTGEKNEPKGDNLALTPPDGGSEMTTGHRSTSSVEAWDMPDPSGAGMLDNRARDMVESLGEEGLHGMRTLGDGRGVSNGVRSHGKWTKDATMNPADGSTKPDTNQVASTGGGPGPEAGSMGRVGNSIVQNPSAVGETYANLNLQELFETKGSTVPIVEGDRAAISAPMSGSVKTSAIA